MSPFVSINVFSYGVISTLRIKIVLGVSQCNNMSREGIVNEEWLFYTVSTALSLRELLNTICRFHFLSVMVLTQQYTLRQNRLTYPLRDRPKLHSTV